MRWLRLSALNCRFVELRTEVLEAVVDQLPVAWSRDLFQGLLSQLVEGDIHPLDGHIHPPVELPQGRHPVGICKAALVACHRIDDDAQKVPAVAPAGLCSVLRVESPARLHELWLGFKQVAPRLIHQVIRPVRQVAGERAIHS